jgi:hypothetical protein
MCYNHIGVVPAIIHCDQALASLERLRLTPQTIAAGKRVDSELRGLVKLVRSLSIGVGPSLQEFNGYSPYFKTCLKRCEYFNVVECKEPAAKGTIVFDKKTILLLGPKAITHQLNQARLELKKGTSLTLKDVQPFRTYNWALALEDRVEADKWVDEILRQHMTFNKKIEDHGSMEVDGEKLPAASTSSSSSSKSIVPSSALAAIPIGFHLAPSTTLKGKAKKPELDKTVEHDAMVMSFFSGKGRAA